MPVRTPYPTHDANYELFDYIERRMLFEKHQPLWLGGAPGSPGSVTPPGGFIGVLPQNRVQWDPYEEEHWSGGSTLMDNLARDRLRLTTYMQQLAYPNSAGSTISAGSFPSWGSGAWIVGFSAGSPPGVNTVQDAIQYLWNHRTDDVPTIFYTWHTFTFSVEGDLEVATGNLEFAAPGPMTIAEVYARIKTAPVGADAILDVNMNGVSILDGDKLTIADGTTTVTAVPTTTAVVKNDYFTMDTDQRGTTTSGAGLVVHVRCKQYVQED